MSGRRAEAQWTPEQVKAIKTPGDVVVSAAAGAGKTSVLTARLQRIIKDKTPLNRLLVVTFTESAALELTGRIAEALRKEGRGAGALLELGRSWISTIHAFCLRLLRERSLEAGLSPALRVCDQDESSLLEREISSSVLERYLSDPFVRLLVDEYADGNAARFEGLLRRIARFLATVPEPARWVRAARHALRSTTLSLERYRKFIQSELEGLRGEALLRASLIRNSYPKALPIAEALESFAARLEGVLVIDDYEKLREAVLRGNLFPKRLPAKPSGVEQEEWKPAYKLADSIRGDLRKRFCKTLLALDGRKLLELEEKTAPRACVLLRLGWEVASAAWRARREIEALSFSDLEHEAYRLLAEKVRAGADSDLVLFEQVLVDEFQDVNPIQDRLIEYASAAGAGGTFLVGDPRQSIYRFRLAEPSIFARKIKEARSGQSATFVALKRNFRSRKPLLDFVNRLFSYLMAEGLDGIGFDDTARLEAGRPEPAADSTVGAPFVEIHLLSGALEEEEEGEDLEKIEREALVVAERLRAVKEAGFLLGEGEERRELSWRDCAVLLRAVKWRVEALARVLEERGIPVTGPGSSDPFATIEMRDLRSLLQTLDNPRQDIPLAGVMLSPFGGFDLSELARLRASDSGKAFHEIVLDSCSERGGLGEKLAAFRERLNRWRRYVRDKALSEALGKILSESNYFAYLSSLPVAHQRRANVFNFLERARRFSRFARQGLSRFVLYLDDLAERNAELGPSGGEETRGDAVTIASIHQSKGLEWPVVVVPDLGRRFNTRDLNGRLLLDKEVGVALQWVDPARGARGPTAQYLVVQDRKRRELLAEEMRLLYVAFTRAREKLILVGTGDTENIRRRFQLPGRADSFLTKETAKRAGSPLDWLTSALEALGSKLAGVTPATRSPRLAEYHLDFLQLLGAASRKSS